MKHNETMKNIETIYSTTGRRIAARLDESMDSLPHDVLERLKTARMQAMKVRKVAELTTEPAYVRMGRSAAMHLGMHGRDGWNPLVSWIPLLALVIGMVSISVIQDDLITQEIADVDTELLTDDLPPAAYTDPGFALFLRMHQGD